MEKGLESWVRQVVVFDTNAYRAVAHNASPEEARARALALVKAERAAGIQALASPSVLWELLAHVADPNDSSYKIAKSAVVAAVEHCSMPLDGGSIPAILASADVQLCLALWQRCPEPLLETDKVIRMVAKQVADFPGEEDLDRMRADLVTISRRAAVAEREFAVSMQRHMVSHMLEDAFARGSEPSRKELLSAFLGYLTTDLARLGVARAHVLRTVSHLGVAPPESLIRTKAQWLAATFEVAISLYIQAVYRIARDNRDLTKGKGANLLWDLQVAFLIGRDHTIGGRPGTIVTSDQEIVTAARECGVDSLVSSYKDYRRRLQGEPG